MQTMIVVDERGRWVSLCFFVRFPAEPWLAGSWLSDAFWIEAG
jgi:hypothetical protein